MTVDIVLTLQKLKTGSPLRCLGIDQIPSLYFVLNIYFKLYILIFYGIFLILNDEVVKEK